ncbi:ribosome silencing factor [Helicobacter aurati]|uniref:Ribosomal silencing factor RsfS n=1 Tax=Helicobacter aurati TaxID=137778 RepID=A0A3D8J5D9_9HELI|nr:ribosome silencing factor [Helicobacter aurati]RDU72709.1 ribosome silencing factor [Helicobacter aurati]
MQQTQKQQISFSNQDDRTFYLLTNQIKETLDSKKASDISIINLHNKEYFADFVIIATASVGKHALALLHYLRQELKSKGIKIHNTDEENEDWIVVDLGEIIVHIFTENHRKKYNLEEFLQSTFINKNCA